MYLQEINSVLDAQFVKIKYDCDGGFERCGKEWQLKLKDARKNFINNGGKHICRQCQLKANNPARRKEVQEKMKQTSLERYGVTNAANTPENIAARNERMFGTQEAIDARTEKTKKTNLERYGVEHAAQSEEKKQKTLEVFREKYGADHPLQTEEVREKIRKTCQERYGVDNPMELPEVRIALAKSILEKYGVEHYNQLPEMKEYLRQNCTTWLAESYANPWAKGTIRPEEWNEKQRETVSKLIELGEWKSGHKNTWHGYYTSKKCKRDVSFFRSGFELIYHWHLDNDSNVEWYHYEPFYIKYQKLDGKPGRYFPDFLVKYHKDDMLYLREIKADYLHDSQEVKIKYEAALQYVFNAPNMKYNILLKGDIYGLGINLMDIIESPLVKITHDPRGK